MKKNTWGRGIRNKKFQVGILSFFHVKGKEANIIQSKCANSNTCLIEIIYSTSNKSDYESFQNILVAWLLDGYLITMIGSSFEYTRQYT